jgi:ATP/maltotriose-dependent transcriptional regulator MalT
VSRQRLEERLDEGLGQGVVLVCAPAGYGKTVLLADWVRRGPRPAAWLSLDAGDNDPARFWRHAVAALDQARPGVADRVELLLGPPAAPSFAGLLTTLINELAAAGEMVLVFDDYHLIDSQAVHASLGFLAEHRPPGLCLVLASRADPPLALARLRGGGQLAELRTAELRFRPQEAAELLQHGVHGADVALPDSAVAALAARTEGWAAGLQLAALSLRGQPDAAGFVAALTGSHRFVLDFLAEEVLERQSGSVRRFLLETSVLERLSGPLCDAVTGRPGSQELLEQVERDGLFLLPLDEVRGWWRYHQLFADLLRVRLQAERPGLDVQLHRNAAAWYEAHELADDAIRHAVAAKETDWAARLVERHFDTVYRLRGEMATIQQWFSALPASLVRSRPRLLLAQAQLAPGPAGLLNPVPAQRAHLRLAQGDVAGAARWTEERGLGVDDETPYRREPEYLVLARVLLAQGHPARALALLDRLHTAAVAGGRDGSIIEAGALRALALAAGGWRLAAGGWRAGYRRGRRPSRRADPGLPAGLRPDFRRRRASHGGAARPASRGPETRIRVPGRGVLRLPGPAAARLRLPACHAGPRAATRPSRIRPG